MQSTTNVSSNAQSTTATSSSRSTLTLAPWTPVPDRHLITIEHPAIIHNVDKGLQTIGGKTALNKVCQGNILNYLNLLDFFSSQPLMVAPGFSYDSDLRI